MRSFFVNPLSQEIGTITASFVYHNRAHLLKRDGAFGGIVAVSEPPSEERNGAQVFVGRCIEPATNTPGAQRVICDHIEPFLERFGIRVDHGSKGYPRWLFDRVQDAGLVRRLAHNDSITVPWFSRNLATAMTIHGPECVFFMDHTSCQEREMARLNLTGQSPTLQEERDDIVASLRGAERWVREWEKEHRLDDAPPILILLAVGLVTPEKSACRRRLNNVVDLATFEGMALNQVEEVIRSSQRIRRPSSQPTL